MPEFHEWDIIDVMAARPVPFDEWMSRITEKDVVYLGEEHRNQWHIEAGQRLLRALIGRDRKPRLALEMFSWDGQAAIDGYVAGNLSSEQFLESSRWNQNWGGPFDDYAPLLVFAREHQLQAIALNPPRPLVRRVASQGLAHALTDPEMNRWNMHRETFVDDPAYRELIVNQLERCHGGMSGEGYQRMYEASLFRDEGMAKTIVDTLKDGERTTRHGLPLVSYTGSGHMQYELPVPRRVARRTQGAVNQSTVYLTSFDPSFREEIEVLVRDKIADYIWLTPVGAHGLPKRCR